MGTIYSDILSRADRGMADILIQIADYFYCKGAGMLSDPPASHAMATLIADLDTRYQAEIMAARGWYEWPPTCADELPGWLLAHCERQTALGDATPPEGWGVEGWPV